MSNSSNYTTDSINHIVYNNRSYEGVVQNFMPKNLSHSDIFLLLEIDKQLKFVNKLVNKNTSIIIDRFKLDLNQPDFELLPHQIRNIKISSRAFDNQELELIEKKKIPWDIIEKYDISPLSQFDLKTLELLGVKTHPILEKLIGDGISSGLIIPLYKNGKLANSVFRKTESLTKLKYGITVPSLDLWGDEEYEEVWLCEGLFDMMALRDQGRKCVSASSCSLNDFQYYKIIKNRPKIVNIFTDKDVSGFRSALKSQKLFGLNKIPSRIYCSDTSKDAAEHFFERRDGWDKIKEIRITSEMINREDDVVDFIEYLRKRQF
jgi:hypothetical protein